ncbi:MAG: ComEC/Rec2 family competence protein [Pirellulales bacterium]
MVVPAAPSQAGLPPPRRPTLAIGPPDAHEIADRAPMLLVVAALAAGIALDRLLATTSLPIRAESWWLLAVAAWCTWLPLWRRGHSTPAAVLLVVSIVASGAAWHELRFNRFAADDLGWYAPDDAAPVCLDAVALGPPRRLAAPPFDPMSAIPTVDRTLFSVHIERLRDGERFINATGTATVIVDGHVLGLRSGDRLRIFGQLGAPSPPRNPGGFDAARFARNDRTLSTVRCGYPECLTSTTSAGWRPTRWLDAVRQAGVRDLARYLDERQATLAAALVLGRRDALDDDTIDAFRATGTLHLLAISGMHVGILAGVWFLLLRLGLLPRGMALAAVVALTSLYAALTGGNPPVIRAAVMIAMLCGALALGRRRIGFNVLAAAVLVLLVLNPTDLFETGPQLSVLASAVLIGVAPLLVTRRPADPLDRLLAQSRPWPERALRWCGQRYWQLTCVSLAVWIATLPLIMARFHTAAPLALVLNPLLIVPVTLALVSGFAILVTGTLLPPLAMAAAVVCRASLDVLAWAVDAGYAYTGRSTWTAGPADWWLLGFYARARRVHPGFAIPPATPPLDRRRTVALDPHRTCAAPAPCRLAGQSAGDARSLGRPRTGCRSAPARRQDVALRRRPSRTARLGHPRRRRLSLAARHHPRRRRRALAPRRRSLQRHARSRRTVHHRCGLRLADVRGKQQCIGSRCTSGWPTSASACSRSWPAIGSAAATTRSKSSSPRRSACSAMTTPTAWCWPSSTKAAACYSPATSNRPASTPCSPSCRWTATCCRCRITAAPAVAPANWPVGRRPNSPSSAAATANRPRRSPRCTKPPVPLSLTRPSMVPSA